VVFEQWRELGLCYIRGQIMANVKVFIGLFIFVQVLFMCLDAWDLLATTKNGERRMVMLESRPVIVLVVISCAVYFLLQLLLSALAPSLPSLVRIASRLAGIPSSSTQSYSVTGFIAVLVGTYFLTTLFDYLVHRFLLHGFWWRLHENHHLPRVVSNLMPGIAARPFVAIPDLVINFCSGLAVLWVLRFTGHAELIAALPVVVPTLIVWFALIACASHSSFLRRHKSVEQVFRALLIITPREHVLHHAADLKGNYGNFTPLWDKLFGTYIAPKTVRKLILGLDYDQDFLGALTAGRLKLPEQMRRRYQVNKVCRVENSNFVEES
jgi:sterol desaturase/sphingolipid hydroxylase (fatty acid hydroxylase superfamily)